MPPSEPPAHASHLAQPSHPFDWTVVRSRHVLRDRWIGVRADACRTPSGALIDPYYVVELPNWVNVVALTDADEAILVRQYRHGIGRTVLELPSGVIDPTDASPVHAARRELLEETGYGDGAWLELASLSPNPANHSNTVYSILATGVRRIAEPGDAPDEQLETVIVPFAELVAMARRNELAQAMHVAAVFYALMRVGWGGVG